MRVKKQSKTLKAEPVKAKAEPLPEIKFDDAVIMGRTFVAYIKSNEWELGALADRVEKKYGKNTLAKLAEEIDFPLDRLARCRSTYRAYKGTPIAESTPNFNFGAATALQADPERVSILQAEPDMKPTKARTIARANKAAKANQDTTTSERWIVIETRRWFDDAMEAARKTFKFGHPAPERHDSVVLRAAVADLDQLISVLRKGALSLSTAAEAIEDALATRPAPPPPMFDEAAE
jgi:hypothetical protein